MSSSVMQANIEVHTRMAASYNRAEPHFRPENQAKVRDVLQELRQRCGGGKLLDLGCGTGFIVQLAGDLFDEIHGVDVTPAMLDQVNTSSGRVFLHNTTAETLPFADNTFDLVTAYSFLHHLEDYRRVLSEAFRVLKPGGFVYADLEPNKLFWQTMSGLADSPALELSPWVVTARDSVLVTDANVERDYGIPEATFRTAEYTKAILGGFDPRRIGDEARELGFRTCDVRLQWYVGQAQVMHGQSFAEAELIESYLRSISPLSDPLFKYVRFILGKSAGTR